MEQIMSIISIILLSSLGIASFILIGYSVYASIKYKKTLFKNIRNRKIVYKRVGDMFVKVEEPTITKEDWEKVGQDFTKVGKDISKTMDQIK